MLNLDRPSGSACRVLEPGKRSRETKEPYQLLERIQKCICVHARVGEKRNDGILVEELELFGTIQLSVSVSTTFNSGLWECSAVEA